MRSSTCILFPVLGLLSGLTTALQPIFSTVEGPFTLRTGRFPFDQFNVTLQFQEDVNAYVPVLTNDTVQVPQFKLENGNLTTFDGTSGAFFGDSASGDLIPLRFGQVPTGVFVLTADFVENTFFSPSLGSVPRLISLNGDIVARSLADGEALFIKQAGNTDTTELVPLDVLNAA